jgi:hypothetical protein
LSRSSAGVGLAILLPRWSAGFALLTVLAATLRFGAPPDRIRNPQVVPASMKEEGEGPKSPFWPSSARTNVGGTIPSDFFMDSKLCGECHKDIYDQWNSSVHHFASFNNRFYRRLSLQSWRHRGRWCACHHASSSASAPIRAGETRSAERPAVVRQRSSRRTATDLRAPSRLISRLHPKLDASDHLNCDR